MHAPNSPIPPHLLDELAVLAPGIRKRIRANESVRTIHVWARAELGVRVNLPSFAAYLKDHFKYDPTPVRRARRKSQVAEAAPPKRPVRAAPAAKKAAPTRKKAAAKKATKKAAKKAVTKKAVAKPAAKKAVKKAAKKAAPRPAVKKATKKAARAR